MRTQDVSPAAVCLPGGRPAASVVPSPASSVAASRGRVALARLTSLALLAAVVGLACLVAPAAADYIDYGDYIHWVGSADTPGNAYGVAVSGNYAYVADNLSGLQVIDITDPENPEVVGSVATPGHAYDVAISGTYAYVADYESGLQVVNISSPTNPQIVGSRDTPGYANGVVISGTYAYVADDAFGLQVIDITVPTNPQIVGDEDTPGYAQDVAVSGTYAYVADWNLGLQVINISDPASPQIVGSVTPSPYAYGVAVSGNYAYVAGGYDGFFVIDITNPAAPYVETSLYTFGGVQDVVVVGNYAYVADYSVSGLCVIDISDPPNSCCVIAAANTRESAYAVAVSGNYGYLANGDYGLQVIDVTNLEFPPGQGGVSTPGMAYNLAVFGSYAYVADYDAGLQAVNISDPAHPLKVGSRDTPGSAYGVSVSGSYAYVADDDHGLQVISVSNPANPQIVGNAEMPYVDAARDVVTSANYAYVADYVTGLVVIDISDPQDPEIATSRSWAQPSYGLGVAVSGDYAYVAAGDYGLKVIDISIPTSPQIVGTCDTPGSAYGVAVWGGYAYVADYEYGLQVIDITRPDSPRIVGSQATPYYAQGVAISGFNAYVTDGFSGLQVVDVTDPRSPRMVGGIYDLTEVRAVVVSGSYAYVVASDVSNSFFKVLNAQLPAGGRTLWRVPLDAATIQAAIDSATVGDTVEVASGTYTGLGNRDIRFNGKGILVRSATGDAADCTVDCQASVGDEHRGFVFEADETANSVLEGFTITGAYEVGGSAILVRNAEPLIRNCILLNNAGGNGSGIQITDTSYVLVEGCRFEGNTATNYGGAAQVADSSAATFRGCEFVGNSAGQCGGAASSHLSDAVFDSCIFNSNIGTTGGGALCLNGANRNLRVRQSTFYGNNAEFGAGILASSNARVLVDNTILAFGVAGTAVACNPGATISLACCDLYGNAGGNYEDCVSGQLGMRGNFSLDPQFRDALGGDFTLDVSSPCAPENSPLDCGLVGALGVRCTEAGDDSDGDGVAGVADLCPAEDASRFDSDGDGCIDDGASARHVEYWDRAAFPFAYKYPAAGCPGITDNSDVTAVQNAMGSWTSVEGTVVSTTGMQILPGGNAQALDGVHTITFTDNDYQFGAGTIAVGLSTSFIEPTWFDEACRRPGQIVDADIIFNPNMTYRTSTQGPPEGIDIESVTTHELGHFFGISHSAVESATMYFVLPSGTAAASLESDDELQMVKAYGTAAKMATASRLSGLVTSGYTSDPVAGAVVFAISEASGETLGCEYTLLDGSYEFIGLPDGDYYIGIHPLDGSSAVGYLMPAYVNDYVAAMAPALFVLEAWDSLESATDDAGRRDPVAVEAGTTAVADITTNIDDVPPEVVATIPGANATGVAIDAAILVSFSERLDTGTLEGNFSLTDTTHQRGVEGNAAFLKDDSLVAFIPVAELEFSSTYRLEIKTGLKDLFDNGLATNFVIYFTTEPEPDVSLASLWPSKGVVGMLVALNGKGFDPVAANNTVRFNGVEAAISEASPAQLVVTVPVGATSGAINVYNATQGKTSNALQFTVLSGDEVPKGFESGICALGATPRAVTVLPDGRYVFVATDAGAVAVVAAPESSGYMTGTAIPVAGGLTDIDAGPSSNRVYAVTSSTGKFYRLDATWGSVGVLSEKPVSAAPRGILVHPNGKRAFIPTDDGEIQIWDIDEASASFESPIGVVGSVDPSVRGELAIGPAGDVLLAITGTGNMLVIDLGTNTVTSTVSIGSAPKDIAIDPAVGRAYVCDERGFLGVASLAPPAALWTVRTGGTLYGVSLTPAGGFALVVNRELDLLSAIDLRQNSSSFLSEVATVQLPENPIDIETSPDGDYAFTISEAESKLVATAIGVGPSLLSLSPSAGPVGTQLVLAGSGFAGHDVVRVNFPGASYEVPSQTSDVAVRYQVPSVSSGMVSVTTVDGGRELKSNPLYFEILAATENDVLRSAAYLAGVPLPAQDGGSVLEASPGGDYLACADESGNLHALVMDPASGQYHKYIGSLALGSNASDVGFTPDGERGFVVLPDSDRVLAVGADRLKSDFLAPLDTIDFSGISGSSIARAEVSPDGTLLLVSDPDLALVHCVDIAPDSPTEYQIIQSVDASGTGTSQVREMAFHPRGRHAYLGFEDPTTPAIRVLDTDPESPGYLSLTAGKVDLYGAIPLQQPVSLGFASGGSHCLVLTRRSADNERSVIMIYAGIPIDPHYTATRRLGFPVDPCREHIRVSPRGDRAVANVHEGGLFNLKILTSPDSLALLQQIGSPSHHLTTVGLAYAVGGTKFYCLSESSDTLSVYDFSAAQTMAVYSGNNQWGVVNQPLAQPLRVKVTDGATDPVAGVPVEFEVTAGGGTFAAAGSAIQVVTTDAAGIAEVALTLGPNLGAGAHTVEARATGLTGSPLVFTADGVADPATLPLTVVSITPEGDATGVSIASAAQVVFSRPVDVFTVTSSTFYIHIGDYHALPAVIGFSDANRRVSLSPVTALEPDTTYWLEITTGIQDESGGPLDAAVASGFTTELPPEITLGTVAPVSAPTGADVVLSGNGFNKHKDLNKALFGNREAYATAGATDFLSVVVPADAVTSSVRVVNTATSDTSNAIEFTVLPPDVTYDNSLVGSVTTSSATRCVALTPDGVYAFAVSPDADKVSVIDLKNLVSVAAVPVGSNPVAVAIDPSGTFAYVANHLDGTVSVVDADDGSPTFCTVDTVFTVGVGPTDLVFTPDGDHLVVANLGSGTIDIVSTDSTDKAYGRVVTSIATGTGTQTVAITPDGGRFYVGTNTGYIVISAANYKVVTSIATGTGISTVSITPDGFLVVLTTDGVVNIYDIHPGSVLENQVVTSIATGTGTSTVSISPDGLFLYLVQETEDQIVIYRLEIKNHNADGVVMNGQELPPYGVEATIVDTLYVGEDPADVAFDPTGSGKVIVTTAGDCKVTVLGDSCAAVVPVEPPEPMRSFPNPFRHAATIRFEIAQQTHVKLAIYDVTGRLVRTLVDADLKPDVYNVAWDGTDRSDRRVASGIYFCRIEASDLVKTTKLLLVR